MSLTLPPIGTSRLLELVSPYAPDDYIAEVSPRQFTGGRRHALSAAQLWRPHLLAVLTSTHSLNLLVTQLPEQAAWRRFARLRSTLPTARMLHEFGQTVGVGGLRAINQYLVGRLLRRTGLHGSGGNMNPRTGDSGFGCPPNRNSVHTVGKPPAVRATSVMPAGNPKRSLVYCRWPAAWRNDYYGKSVRGLNPPSPLRKTNWVWAKCFSTACA